MIYYDYDVPFKHAKTERAVFEDLLQKYWKYGTLYIGVDFDNTLQMYGDAVKISEIELAPTDKPIEHSATSLIDASMFSDINVLDKPTCVLDLLLRAQKLGMKMCLWTLPTSQKNLDWKIEWCKRQGLQISFINESPLLSEYSKKFGKPHFNLLLDDVAGLEQSYRILWNLCTSIEGGVR